MSLPSTGAAAPSTVPSTVMTPMAATTDFGSTENPLNAIEARAISGTENDNYLRDNYQFIPSSFWANQGIDQNNANGYVELEEYLGETRREQFAAPGDDLSREDERQVRARNKALRLRSILGY